MCYTVLYETTKSDSHITMSLKYIRDYYGVPAYRGAKIFFNGREGRITSAKDAHLRVKFPDKKNTQIIHPTFNVKYLSKTD